MINEQNKNVLLVKVDWNGKFQPGTALSPRFTFIGVGFTCPERVSCKLERFETDGWNEKPTMYPVPGGKGWYFQQPMTIPADIAPGTYFITIDAVFQKEDSFLLENIKNFHYHESIQFEICQNKKNEPLVIRATGGAIINTQGLNWDRERDIVIEADDRSIINLSKNEFLSQAAPVPVSADHGETDGNTEPWFFKFEPIGVGETPPPRDMLLLTAEVNGETYFYHICTKAKVVLGRGHKNQDIDYVYRYYRDSEEDFDACSASLFFSRRHLELKVGDTSSLTDDLTFTALGRWGTSVCCRTYGNRPEKTTLPVNKPHSHYTVSDLKTKRLELVLADIGHLEMKGYSDPGTAKLETVLQKKAKNAMAVNSFWRIGTAAGVDVLVLKRQREVTFSDLGYAKQLADAEEAKKARKEGRVPRSLDMTKSCWNTDPYCGTDTYLFILRAAPIGTASGAIAPPGAVGMNLRHAAVYFYEGRFGLVNYDTNSFNYQVQGRTCQLKNGECTPLVPGMVFRIGNVNFHVYESYCSWLRMQRDRRQHEENEKAIVERKEMLSQASAADGASQGTL